MERAADALVDAGSFRPVSDGLSSRDPLSFPGYPELLERARTEVDESVLAGPARIGGHDVEVALFEFGFLGGSVGEVAGERIARALERAAERRTPFVLRTATGGSRMQEGMRSLVQMPKMVAARETLGHAGCPFIVLLGHPTTGGVLASIAALADVTLAREDATIGFAGPRVAEVFLGRALGPGSHTAEMALRSGLVDALVDAGSEGAAVTRVLDVLAPDEPAAVDAPPITTEMDALPDPWDVVTAARAPTVRREASWSRARPTPWSLFRETGPAATILP